MSQSVHIHTFRELLEGSGVLDDPERIATGGATSLGAPVHEIPPLQFDLGQIAGRPHTYAAFIWTVRRAPAMWREGGRYCARCL